MEASDPSFCILYPHLCTGSNTFKTQLNLLSMSPTVSINLGKYGQWTKLWHADGKLRQTTHVNFGLPHITKAHELFPTAGSQVGCHIGTRNNAHQQLGISFDQERNSDYVPRIHVRRCEGTTVDSESRTFIKLQYINRWFLCHILLTSIVTAPLYLGLLKRQNLKEDSTWI